MTIDLDAIESRCNAPMAGPWTTDRVHVEVARADCQALIAEVKRLRADQAQGGKDYCDLMERHDAQHNRAVAAEYEAKQLRIRLAQTEARASRDAGAMLVQSPCYSTEAVDTLLAACDAITKDDVDPLSAVSNILYARDAVRTSREPAK